MSEILRVIDLETTGFTPPEAEIIELAWQDVVKASWGAWVLQDDACGSRLYDCVRPCPPEVLAVHHILPWQIAGIPLFDRQHAVDMMDGPHERVAKVYVAHNASFERAFLGDLKDPVYDVLSPRWVCTYKAALRIWPEAPSHGNQALMYWLKLHEDLDEDRRHPPHRAAPDVYVTAHILIELLKHTSVEEMIVWSDEPALLPRCPIGQEWKGKRWSEVDLGFLGWIMRQADMGADIRWNAQREIDRRKG